MSDSEIAADIVIAGGGTAGCVVAGRLSDAFPNLDIVIVENGPDSKDDPFVDQPLAGIFQVWKAPETFKYYRARPNEYLNGAESIVPTGNVLGGGTCVNWLAYQNAAKSDFDDWDTPGWSFDELQSAINKSVRYEEDDPNGIHSKDGAMPVSYGGFRTCLGEEVDVAFKDTNVPKLDDMADFVTGHGYGRSIKWIGKDGYRSTTARHYIYNKPRPNLRILTKRTVIEVLIENDTAVGVKICDAPAQRGATEVKNVQVIRARKQVIVSAGALGTPCILERSGVGMRDVLTTAGIEVKAALDVGKEYQDHQSIVQGYKFKDIDGLDRFAKQEPEAVVKALAQWKKDGTGIISTSVLDYMFKLRPTDEEVKAMGPGISEIWADSGLTKSDKPLVTGALGLMYLGDYKTIDRGCYLSICHWLNYPGSRGSIHITDTNPHIPPALDTGMLSHPGDIEAHKWAYKKMRDIARRLPSYIGEEPSRHPTYPPGSPAGVASIDTPKSANDAVKYSAEDDKALEEYIRFIVKTTWHSMATCPMKPKEHGGVVDPKLNVYGVKNLKLADLSICPKNVGTNTTSVALIIGERCAEIVQADMGLESAGIGEPIHRAYRMEGRRAENETLGRGKTCNIHQAHTKNC